MAINYNKATFKIYWRHLWRYHWAIITMVVSVIVATISQIVVPLYYKKFFDVLSGPLASADKVTQLVAFIWMILAIKLVAWVAWRVISFVGSYFETRTMADLYNSCFAYLHKHSVGFFNNNFTGALVKKVHRFVVAFSSIMDVFVWTFLPNIVTAGLIIYILARRNLWIGLAFLVWVIIFCVVNYFFSLYKLKYDTQRAELDSKVGGTLADTFTNQLNVKLFNGYQRERQSFKNLIGRLQSLRQFTWNLANIFDAVQALLMFALEIGVMFYAIKLWQQQILTVGDFVLIQSYLINLFDRLWNFGRVVRFYYEAMADAREMVEILELPHEIKDSTGAKQLKVASGQIEFVDVCFSYNQTRQVIKDFNLVVKPKEKIALVGPSGGGKSTVVNILLRQHDLDSGKILVDGQEISRVTQESLWQNIGMVNQDPVLFHRSLKENIGYGRPGSSLEEIARAAKLAQAHNFIKSFTEGYDTFVGERGVRLSGGERQRVAIARAIIKNAPILVLDEATSSLDSESEQLIQIALGNLMKNKTVIVVAHRLSTIMKMDRIVVIDGGQIIEQGSHKELLKKSDGFYKRLWEKQVGGFIG